ncbi:MAG: hypothetical protein C5B59_05605 [Bacteroidetes bacterium]|nr:MAG: hypothetical protein C5B59_05605 [Bacteroidota bacterium]
MYLAFSLEYKHRRHNVQLGDKDPALLLALKMTKAKLSLIENIIERTLGHHIVFHLQLSDHKLFS